MNAAGIPFEVVPGICSAVAAPAYAGIPLTHRKRASSFAVIIGHNAADAACAINWQALAQGVDTLVILMGLQNIHAIMSALLASRRL